MPEVKQKKSESKQDYLLRCTATKVEGGMSRTKAFQECNAGWKGSRAEGLNLTLEPEVEIQMAEEGEEGKGKKTFLITAYTGAKVERFLFGGLIIDLAGISVKKKFPVFHEHDRGRIVGYADQSRQDAKGFYVGGTFAESTDAAKEVLALAEEGYPWQASIGVKALKIEDLPTEKHTAKVNGETVRGPLTIWRKTQVGEVSFVSLGADDETAAVAFGDMDYHGQGTGGKRMDLETLKAEHPEVYKQVFDLGKEAGIVEGTEAGAKDERSRVLAIFAAGEKEVPQEVILGCVKDGTPEAEAYKSFFEAMKARRNEDLSNLQTAAPEATGRTQHEEEDVSLKGGEKPKTKEEAGTYLTAEAKKIQASEKVSFGEAFRRVKMQHPEETALYLSYPELTG